MYSSTTTSPSGPFSGPEIISEFGVSPVARKTPSAGSSASALPFPTTTALTCPSPFIPESLAPSSISTPASSFSACRLRGSSIPFRKLLLARIVTSAPKAWKMWANSAAITPPPMMMIRPGRSLHAVRVWACTTPGRFTPSTRGISGRDPVEARTASASTRLPSMKGVPPSRLPSPERRLTPASLSRTRVMMAWISPISARSTGQETRGGRSRTPSSDRVPAYRTVRATSARAQTTMHPWWRHCPPRPPRSTRVTSRPARAMRIAARRPAGPPPMTRIMARSEELGARVHRLGEDDARDRVQLEELLPPELPDRQVDELELDGDVLPVRLEDPLLVEDGIPLDLLDPHLLGELLDDPVPELLLCLGLLDHGLEHHRRDGDRRDLDLPELLAGLRAVDGIDGPLLLGVEGDHLVPVAFLPRAPVVVPPVGDEAQRPGPA